MDLSLFDPAPAASLDGASFADLLARTRPESLPAPVLRRSEPGGPSGSSPGAAFGRGERIDLPHATTILAIRYREGVAIAGDRRATEGFHIAHRSIEKVFATDDSSAVAIAGVVGPALDMVRLFQTELEHYEKMEGERLTLEGRANKLAQFMRVHLPQAMQGLVVVPIFAGFDERRGQGRIFSYDVTGGRYEESDYAATGSGGRDARATIKKRYRPGVSREEVVKIALEALFDASEEDVGTGGPDVLRKIYPNIARISAEGFREVPDDEIGSLFDSLLEEREAAGRIEPRETVPEAYEYPAGTGEENE
ncbi:MAG: proteasome subunit beta [Actinomycetota bacterium]